MSKSKRNSYRSVGSGMVVGNHDGMAAIYVPKVRLVGQIQRLAAQEIAAAFGIVGKAYIDALRDEMLQELADCPVPVSSWREIADRVRGRDSLGTLNLAH